MIITVSGISLLEKALIKTALIKIAFVRSIG